MGELSYHGDILFTCCKKSKTCQIKISIMDKLKAVLTRREDPESANITEDDRGFISEALDASTLSYSTRIKGFIACFILGVGISILSTVIYALTWKLGPFCVLYSLGNIVALASTCFLMGPVNQIKKMFAPTRWIATSLMLLFLILTLVSAAVFEKKGLTVLFCILQFCAMTWYSISYIPYARDAVKKCVDGCLG